MSLSGYAISRPWSVAVINLGLLVLGLFYLNKLPVSLFPQVRLPYVSVRVPYPGAEALETEQKVVVPLEQQFNRLPGLSRLISFVRPNGVEFILGFRFGVQESDALIGIRQALDRTTSVLPDGVLNPEILSIDVRQTPVLIYALSRPLNESERVSLLTTLQKGQGVSSAELIGQSPPDLAIALDSRLLSEHQVAPLEVFEAVKSKFASVPWGEFSSRASVGVGAGGRDGQDLGSEISSVRGVASPDSLEWITLKDRRSFKLQSLGSVDVVRPKDEPRVQIDGKEAVSLSVFKQAEASTPAVVEEADRLITEWQKSVGVSVEKIIDQSQYIEENAAEVWIALLWGGFFSVLTVLFFLADFRSSLITGTALPVSICASFAGLAFFGFSLNMLTLLALSLSIGLLIDDAVVVRESIFRELERGRSAKQAALIGTRRVFSPVIATTLCIIAVFFPVAMTGGLIGQFFKEFGLTICIAVTLSTWVAFTLDPMLSAYFSKEKTHKKLDVSSNVTFLRSNLKKMRLKALWFTDYSFKNPLMIIGASCLSLALAIVFAYRGGVDFMAKEDRNQILVEFVNPPGKSAEYLDELARKIAQVSAEIEGVRGTMAEIALGSDSGRGLARVLLTEKNSGRVPIDVMQEQLRQKLKENDLDVLVKDPPPIEGVGGEPPLSLYLYGEDLSAMQAEALVLKKNLGAIKGSGSVVIDTQGMSQTIHAQLNDRAAGEIGLDVSHIQGTGRLALSGLGAGRILARDASQVFQIPELASSQDLLNIVVGVAKESLRFDAADPQNQSLVAQALGDILVPSSAGRFPMSRFVQFSESSTPQAIDREKGSRKVVLYGSPDGSVSFGQVLADWQRVAESVQKPFSAELGGDREIFEEMVSNFSFALVGGVIFIFVVLVILYENIWMPFVVLLSLPLAAVGGFLLLGVKGDRLAMGSLIGFILLVGVSAKNGILLVDAVAQTYRKFGMRLAVLYAVNSRARPILMTSVALIVGMLPTVFLSGSGSEFRQPMALSIIGGVVSSTALAFLVLPAIFGLLSRMGFLRERSQATKT